MGGNTYVRGVFALSACVAAIAVSGCTLDNYGVVGSSDDVPVATSASVNADRLCSWRHRTNFDHGPPLGSRGIADCARTRQTYNTCDIVFYVTPTGGRVLEAEDHGQNYCNALAQATTANCPQYCYQARGSDFVFYLRLDNPARRWGQGFVQGDKPTACDKYLNQNGQHILRCVHIQGNPPVPWGPVPRATLRRACAGRLMSNGCEAASQSAYRKLDVKRYMRWRRGYLAEHGVTR